MAWLELSLIVAVEQQAAVEAALEDLGALAVTLLDAEDHPILEPAPGETPMWPRIAMSALFETDCDRLGLVHVLTELVPDLAPERIAFHVVEDQDWTRVWMDQFHPMRFGRRLWIYPWNSQRAIDEDDAVVVRLDPGLAFGTGTHPTTALCLEWLDARDLAGKRVIDYGCGSGVLAIAALKLGAADVIGVDNDPQALIASRDNAERNGVASNLHLCAPDGFADEPADALIANILAAPLDELAARFARNVKAGGEIALSGILRGQESALCERYAEWFEAIVIEMREDWVRISARRRT
ncbi:MAG TPA: 50S ribosomal protein L11 methyltransferase [Rhodanobacteraceae bacterium]|jgi:ribosomal protein L11 methyltransferase|nr:50S ribosomal protein L11 methyltransferase [Rhodanobacteraceae bacterium]